MGLGSPWQKEWHGGRHLLQAGLIEQGNRPNSAQHQQATAMAQYAMVQQSLAQQQGMAQQHAASQYQQNNAAHQHQSGAEHQNLRQMADAVISTAKLNDAASGDAKKKVEKEADKEEKTADSEPKQPTTSTADQQFEPPKKI